MNYYPWMEKCCDDVDMRDLTDLGVGRAFNFFAIFEKYERKNNFILTKIYNFCFYIYYLTADTHFTFYCRTIFLYKYLVRIMGQLIWYYFKLLSAQVRVHPHRCWLCNGCSHREPKWVHYSSCSSSDYFSRRRFGS